MSMDTSEKLSLLGSAAQYEIADQRVRQQRSGTATPPRGGPAGALCMGETQSGSTGTLLRVLQSSRCEHDCLYCPLRRSSDPRRAVLEPDELARAFSALHQRGRVDGLMLSSATDGSPDQALARMLDTVRILRHKHAYEGYVHVKALPGASRAALEAAASLADRISLNVEVPGPAFLEGLRTGKRWQEDIERQLGWLHELDVQGAIRSGITTQLLIGLPSDGGMASDRDLSESSRALRRRFALRNVHYGSFTPVSGTPLAEQPAPDARRRARLYQLDWLSNSYDYADSELNAAFDTAGNLPLSLDPKLAVSLARPDERPVEINSAPYEELLRVPGIGPISARRIVDFRSSGAIRDLRDLRVLGVVARRAAPFVQFNGKSPPEAPAALLHLRRSLRAIGPRPVQLRLWPEDAAI